ncbi:thiaminase II [Paenibacillus koleovorans]|uniref:thiaminase II n=1 Tax=Paenibacillus koleovorans TaxID=121608 RepID=UPI000FD72BD2|nr:thiaminase II [Paenibacillus koleovorans]
MRFSQQLRQAADSSWEASFRHPFVTGIADGTLPLASFRYYVLNDSYYLSVFAQVQGLGAAKAHDLFTSGRMAAHIQGTYNTELAMHEKFARLLDIGPEEKAAFEPSPTAYAYTSHLLRAGYTGHLGDIVAAMLPCYWLYLEIGDRLHGAVPDEPIYREWIGTYGSERFREVVQEQIDRLDAIAERVTEAERERMKRHFLISSRYEYAFWEMAYRVEKWAF